MPGERCGGVDSGCGRFARRLPAGRSGWFKFYSTSDLGMFAAESVLTMTTIYRLTLQTHSRPPSHQ